MLYNPEVNRIKALQHKHNLGCPPMPIELQIEDESFENNGRIGVKYRATVKKVDLELSSELRFPFKIRGVRGQWLWSDAQERGVWSEDLEE